MTEVRLQTHWPDCDPAGIVYFANFFRFVGIAEEEMFLLANKRRQKILDDHDIWMPRVETHAKFIRPIQSGSAIRIRMDPQFKGSKTVRFEFEVIDDETEALFATGFLTVVCVDRETFKAKPIPEEIKNILSGK